MRSDRTRFSNNLTSLDVLLVDTTEKKTNVVSSLTLIKKLTEHLDTSYSGSSRSVTETNELNSVVNVDSTSLDTSGNYCTTTCDREDILDRHKEWFLVLTNRNRNV